MSSYTDIRSACHGDFCLLRAVRWLYSGVPFQVRILVYSGFFVQQYNMTWEAKLAFQNILC
jgi:hypothetical protein